MKENNKEEKKSEMTNNSNIPPNDKLEFVNNKIPISKKITMSENDGNDDYKDDFSQTESNNESETKPGTKMMNKKAGSKKRSKLFSIGLAVIPLLVLSGMIYFLTSPYGQNLITSGTPLPEVTIEKIEFHENQIVAFIRNTGPEEVTISQADVNDRIQSAAIEPSQVIPRLGEAKVIIPFLWNTAEPYEVGITTSDGTRFSNTVEAAAPAPVPNSNQIIIFAILGIFVGVVPILIGLAWYPFMRKITKNQYNFFLSLTAGLLVFLGIDAILESNEIAAGNLAKVFNGQILVPVIVISTFLGLYFMSEYFVKRAEYKSSLISVNIPDSEKASKKIQGKSYLPPSQQSIANLDKSTDKQKHTIKRTEINNNTSDSSQSLQQIKNKEIIKPLAISLMVAIGIGFHNFGEGLAIGAAVLLGEIALSTFLIIGFTIHNTTEGLAIVAPLAKTGRLMIKRLLIMGLIAGVPTVLGTWIGGFVYSPMASVIFLSIGAGAIFQVVYSLVMWMLKSFRQNESEQTVTVNYNKSDNNRQIVKSTPVVEPEEPKSGISIVIGFIAGMLIMYLTGLFV
ncbi:ZIP family metal transporter [Candidatus Nitrosocosmicus agrestis]|jgi:zinc transporter ZupT|uniref:ZIP family metal transporter n=2 Tax=Candidatus Nitrosocosmicus agrestis TaxID=2563600 RepID=UPI00191793D1|nr:ZIP family metal transporter [Candidatus Nitrosocosmicus sp. SS]